MPDDARAARGALLEDVVVLLPVRPQGLLPHEDEDLHPPGVAELEGLDVVEVHVGRAEKSTPASVPAGPRRPASSG